MYTLSTFILLFCLNLLNVLYKATEETTFSNAGCTMGKLVLRNQFHETFVSRNHSVKNQIDAHAEFH